jgi:hydroxypyruvate reductase
VNAVNPSDLVERNWRTTRLAERQGGVWIIAAGKAATSMATSAARLLGTRLRGGLVTSPSANLAPASLDRFAGGHPSPTPNSLAAGRRALRLAAAARADETLLVLISGGASALLAMPAQGLTLDDKRGVTEALLRAGADVAAFNAVRKHLSALKGGRLAIATEARCCTLAVSDVVGDDLSVIGSGPTVADSSTFDDALQTLRRCDAVGTFPPRVVAHLTRGVAGEIPETPKPGDPRLARNEALVVGGRRDAMAGAADEARRRGYRTHVLDIPVTGEARQAARAHFRRAAALAGTLDHPLCLVSSGETTVRVRGSGLGGRNQEFALAAAMELGSLGREVACASVATDGVDGPTSAAGAIADASTLDRAGQAGISSPDEYLRRNDAFRFFEALGDLIETGPTDTNVGDLQIVLIR